MRVRLRDLQGGREGYGGIKNGYGMDGGMEGWMDGYPGFSCITARRIPGPPVRCIGSKFESTCLIALNVKMFVYHLTITLEISLMSSRMTRSLQS